MIDCKFKIITMLLKQVYFGQYFVNWKKPQEDNKKKSVTFSSKCNFVTNICITTEMGYSMALVWGTSTDTAPSARRVSTAGTRSRAPMAPGDITEPRVIITEKRLFGDTSRCLTVHSDRRFGNILHFRTPMAPGDITEPWVGNYHRDKVFSIILRHQQIT